MLSQAQTERLTTLVTDLLGNDPQFRAALPIESAAKAVLQHGISLAELMAVVAEGYADRPALAQRAMSVVTNGTRQLRVALPRYETISYAELWRATTAVAAALHGDPVQSGDRVATLGAPSVGYTTFDMAIARLGAVSVPLHAGAPLRMLQPVVDETEPCALACSAEHLATAVALGLACPSIDRLVVFDYDGRDDDHHDTLASAREDLAAAGGRIDLETLAEVVDRGVTLPGPPSSPPQPERLAAIIYTSGSSGTPKGAMQPERLLVNAWSYVAAMFIERGFALPAITLNYLPMSHTGGRAMLYSTLGSGGTAFFSASTDLSTFVEDLALVRPTQLNFVPRVWELLHSEFVSRVERGGADHDTVLAELRTDVLGGRYLSALTGSAPISSELAAWVEELIDTHLMDALGATESGSVAVDGRLQRPPITSYKLDDVPELGYFSTDRPHRRGELLIKSTALFQGYYRRDGLTSDVFDDEGYYRTGDIVAELRPDEVRYLDRRNNVVKLSQGEFVTISKLETLYDECDGVDQIFLYGNSERAYLLAVVVPTSAAVATHGTGLVPAILRSLKDTAARAGLESYEVPRDVIIEPTRFSVDNGLMTNVGKLARRELRDRYGDELEARYAEHAAETAANWQALVHSAADRPLLEIVCHAASYVLGNLVALPSPDDHFTELGGDSLSALSFASALSDVVGVEIPVSVVIGPANDLRAVAEHITALRQTGTTGPTFASVHGHDATSVTAADLTLDKFLDETTIAAAPSLPSPAADPRHVLLTGATGYLGRYLALEWLDRMAAIGGTVTCLVRADNDGAASDRLTAAFDQGDAALLRRYRALAKDRLTVFAGDKNKPRFGLDEDTWKRLADEVDLIVDPAALVNHMLPYPHLFGPNVVGTAELIRLAITTRQKSIVHVSSVAVGTTVEPSDFDEDTDIRLMSPDRRVEDAYASGYATSKWAGEVLLREVHDLCGLPVRVFRCDMLMAEATYRGQVNVPDMVTRLLFSLAATGLAPGSFYTPGPDGERSRSHFDGLRVDFVAHAISTIGADLAADHRTFHVVNPHDDGIGLDQFVDWISEAGYPIERIDDHRRWYERFESALRNLPDRQRRASLLPIVEAFRWQQPPLPGSFAPTAVFEAAIAAHGIGDGQIPGIDQPVIEKYLTDLEYLGYL